MHPSSLVAVRCSPLPVPGSTPGQDVRVSARQSAAGRTRQVVALERGVRSVFAPLSAEGVVVAVKFLQGTS